MPTTLTQKADPRQRLRQAGLRAYRLICTARRMADLYDEERELCSTYVHSTSRGHEAIQLASAFYLQPFDFAAPYYRDESFLLGLGFSPEELMLQLLAKRDDPFSGGRTYYAHPSVKREGFPIIPHQSSATGMQAIPATGMAHGIKYLEQQGLLNSKSNPVVVCSIGDGAMTEGEVSEALQMAVLKQLPVVYLVQDNQWGISATASEMRAMDAYQFAAGFKGLERMRLVGSDFFACYEGIGKVMHFVREQRKPILVHAKVPLLGHHTSGVRKEWYRDEADLKMHTQDDPLPVLHHELLENFNVDGKELDRMKERAIKEVEKAFKAVKDAPDPDPQETTNHIFAPTPVQEEKGERSPGDGEKVVMVDAALHAIREIMEAHPEALFYGQDVGGRLGGVFREAVNLTKIFGESRVFNTPIQEAYIIGSTAGMSAVGCKPIVEIQFADYIWPGMNQLVEELSKSCYLSKGKYPVQALIRVPIGAYGGGGPYHSGSVESTLATVKGIKVAYPSNAADIKGLMKAAFLDPNPVVMLEHKGLYWSKVPGTQYAKMIEPDADYVLPLGKAALVQQADEAIVAKAQSLLVVTYGMGVHWALHAIRSIPGQVTLLDLRTINPLDWQTLESEIKKHSRVLVVSEEPVTHSFAQSLAGRISSDCFEYLDAPVRVVGAQDVPAIPLNKKLEQEVLPNAEKVRDAIEQLLKY